MHKFGLVRDSLEVCPPLRRPTREPQGPLRLRRPPLSGIKQEPRWWGHHVLCDFVDIPHRRGPSRFSSRAPSSTPDHQEQDFTRGSRQKVLLSFLSSPPARPKLRTKEVVVRPPGTRPERWRDREGVSDSLTNPRTTAGVSGGDLPSTDFESRTRGVHHPGVDY